jgi:hypothetical protein
VLAAVARDADVAATLEQNGLYFGRGCFSYHEVRSSLAVFSAGASARVRAWSSKMAAF